MGACIHMAVAAAHVAELAQVELQHPQGAAARPAELALLQARFELLLSWQSLGQQVQLLAWGERGG
jgi:hypothetical protein